MNSSINDPLRTSPASFASSNVHISQAQVIFYLVASHPVLLHLLKLALKLCLAFALLLRTTHVNLLSVHLFSIHLIHSLMIRGNTSGYNTSSQ